MKKAPEEATVITAEALRAVDAELEIVQWMLRVYPGGAYYITVARAMQMGAVSDLWLTWLVLECPLGTWPEHCEAAAVTEDCDVTEGRMITECVVGTWDERVAMCGSAYRSEIGGLCALAESGVEATAEARLAVLDTARRLARTAAELVEHKYSVPANCVDLARTGIENVAGARLTPQMLVDSGFQLSQGIHWLELLDDFTFTDLALELCEEDLEWLVELCPLGTWEEHVDAAESAAWYDDVLDELVISCPVGTWEQRLELCRRRGLRSPNLKCRMALSCVVGTLEQRRAVIAEVLDFIFDCELTAWVGRYSQRPRTRGGRSVSDSDVLVRFTKSGSGTSRKKDTADILRVSFGARLMSQLGWQHRTRVDMDIRVNDAGVAVASFKADDNGTPINCGKSEHRSRGRLVFRFAAGVLVDFPCGAGSRVEVDAASGIVSCELPQV